MNPVSPIATIHEVSDPDLLVAGIRGADLEPCRLSRHAVPSRLARIVWPELCLDMVRLGPAMLFSGATPRDCFTLIFVLVCPEAGHAFNFALEHSDGYMGFFPPGSPIDAATPAGYANATLTIPAAAFYAVVATHFPEMPEAVLVHGAGMRVGSAAQASLRTMLAALEDDISSGRSCFANARVRQQIESRVLAAFLSALRSGCENLVEPPATRIERRLRRMREARDFIAAHLQQPLYLEDICSALGLTPRGVEKLFRDLLGVNPIAYLRHQRLHGVRRALKAAEPALGKVKEAALDWGFYHLGRFSRDYRAFFGEGPTETLERRRR